MKFTLSSFVSTGFLAISLPVQAEDDVLAFSPAETIVSYSQRYIGRSSVEVGETALYRNYDSLFEDFDGDGDIDIISGSRPDIIPPSFYENVGGGQRFIQHYLRLPANRAEYSVQSIERLNGFGEVRGAADIDGDGIVEFLTLERSPDFAGTVVRAFGLGENFEPVLKLERELSLFRTTAIRTLSDTFVTGNFTSEDALDLLIRNGIEVLNSGASSQVKLINDGEDGVAIQGVGDFNGDGNSDLVGNNGSFEGVYLGNGNSNLSATDFAVTSPQFYMGANDVDGDGSDELLLFPSADGEPLQLISFDFDSGAHDIQELTYDLENPAFALDGPTQAPFRLIYAQFVDYDSDGDMDIIGAVTPIASFEFDELVKTYGVWFNEGGNFTSVQPTGVAMLDGDPLPIEFKDVTGDGLVDALFSNFFIENTPNGFTPDGPPMIDQPYAPISFESRSTRIAIEDLDGDGSPEILANQRNVHAFENSQIDSDDFFSRSGESYYIFSNDGSLEFEGSQVASDPFPEEEIIIDFNGDGFPDRFNEDRQDGTFVRLSITADDIGPEVLIDSLERDPANDEPIVVDYDEDGDQDLVIIQWGTTPTGSGRRPATLASIYLNDGLGSFTFFNRLTLIPESGPDEPSDFARIALADFDEDGLLDVLSLGGFSFTIFGSGGSNFSSSPVEVPTDRDYDFLIAGLPAVGDLNNDGKIDFAISDQGAGAIYYYLNEFESGGASPGGEPELSVHATATNEGLIGLPVEFRLSHPSDVEVSFQFSTVGGSANPQEDFLVWNGLMTFQPGETFQTILLTMVDDAVVEPDESYTLALSNPDGLTFNETSIPLDILNDDSVLDDYGAFYGLSVPERSILADGDGDGIAFFLEYAFNLDPTENATPDYVPGLHYDFDNDEPFGLPILQVDGDTIRYLYLRRTDSYPKVEYIAEICDDAGTFQPATPSRVTQITEHWEEVEITLKNADVHSPAQCFARVRVEARDLNGDGF